MQDESSDGSEENLFGDDSDDNMPSKKVQPAAKQRKGGRLRKMNAVLDEDDGEGSQNKQQPDSASASQEDIHGNNNEE